jgi:F0F1-type ATP synthase membrane subunit b/b'
VLNNAYDKKSPIEATNGKHADKNSKPLDLNGSTPEQAIVTVKTLDDAPRFVAPTHHSVDKLKLLTELENIVEGSKRIGPVTLRFDEERFHMTIMKIRANLPEEMKKASKLAKDAETLLEQAKEQAQKVVDNARDAAQKQIDNSRQDMAAQRDAAQRELAQLNETILREKEKSRTVVEQQSTEIVTKAQAEAALILSQANNDAKLLVSDNVIVQEAQVEADDLRLRAQQEADAIRRGADDYAKDVLMRIEDVMNKTISQVQRGREMLDRTR